MDTYGLPTGSLVKVTGSAAPEWNGRIGVVVEPHHGLALSHLVPVRTFFDGVPAIKYFVPSELRILYMAAHDATWRV